MDSELSYLVANSANQTFNTMKKWWGTVSSLFSASGPTSEQQGQDMQDNFSIEETGRTSAGDERIYKSVTLETECTEILDNNNTKVTGEAITSRNKNKIRKGSRKTNRHGQSRSTCNINDAILKLRRIASPTFSESEYGSDNEDYSPEDVQRTAVDDDKDTRSKDRIRKQISRSSFALTQTISCTDEKGRKVSVISVTSVKHVNTVVSEHTNVCSTRSLPACLIRLNSGLNEDKKEFRPNFCRAVSSPIPTTRLTQLWIDGPKILSGGPETRGKITGHLKLLAQYFENSQALRVIVKRATNLYAQKGKIWGKFEVINRDTEQKGKKAHLRKVKAQPIVAFNEELFFEKIAEDRFDQLVLKVRLYNKNGLFSRKKLLGEMIIPVYKYDLSMSTSINGYLRQNKAQIESAADYDNDTDIEVITDDRSIAASVAASVRSSPIPSPRFYRLPYRCTPLQKSP